MNDANLPCNGPGRSFKGTCALTEFKVQIDRGNKELESREVRQRRSRFQRSARFAARTELLRQIRQEAGHRPGQLSPSTATTRRRGGSTPARAAATSRASSIFKPDQPLEILAGRTLNLVLVQNHGGWNSDDLMNNNLGRFRLSVTDAVDVPAPAFRRARRRRSRSIPRSATRPRARRSLLIGARVAGVVPKRMRRSKRFGSNGPQGATALTLQPRGRPRPTAF